MTTPVLPRRRLLAVAAALLIAPSPTLAQSDGDGRGRYCSATALTQDEACQHQIMDAYFIARTKCTNLSDPRCASLPAVATAAAARKQTR